MARDDEEYSNSLKGLIEKIKIQKTLGPVHSLTTTREIKRSVLLCFSYSPKVVHSEFHLFGPLNDLIDEQKLRVNEK